MVFKNYSNCGNGEKKRAERDEQLITLAKLPIHVSQKALFLSELKHMTFPPISVWASYQLALTTSEITRFQK